MLVYAGGIDDKRSANAEDVKTAKNFVRAALAESLAGKPVSTPDAPRPTAAASSTPRLSRARAYARGVYA